MKRVALGLTLAALAAAGAIAAALIAAPTAAASWDWMHLPAHYNVSSVSYGTCPGSGILWRTVSINGVSMGSTCDAGFQAAVDAYIDSTICTVNPDVGGSACTPTTTTIAATTGTTTTDPAVTTTITTTTTTAADPGSSTPTTTQPIQTSTTTAVDPQVAAINARVDQLEQQIAMLTSRVGRLEFAGDAASLAFQQALANGQDVPTAAAIARGTWMNAVYGLGEFGV